MTFYPNIREEMVETMTLVLRFLAEDPEYLERPECKYTDRVKTFFRNQAGAVDDTAPGIFGEEGVDEVEVLDLQIQRVLNDLDRMGAQMANAETNERLNYFKTKANLVEKLIGMRERVFNLKELNEFRGTILMILEDVCTKDQITAFMLKIEGIMGIKSE